MPEDTIMYTYRLYKEDEWLQYMGTYKAYNEIGDAGIDAWANMYESYYYGDLIFLGRNKHSDSGYMYGGYANYEYMGEVAEAAIQEFSR